MFRSVNTKIVVAFIAVFVVAFCVSSWVNFNHIREHEHELTDSMGAGAAEGCAAAVQIAYDNGSGGDFVPGTEDYDNCRKYLRELCQANEMNYLYVYRRDAERGTITYLMAVGASDDEDRLINQERPYGTVVQAAMTDVERRVLAGEEVDEAIETDNQFGQMLDWVARAGDLGDGVLAAASYSVSEQRMREIANTWSITAPFLLAFIVLLVMEIVIFRKSVVKPLRVIADRMRGFTAEDPDEFEPLGIASRDEVGDIAEAFEGMAGDIGKYVSNIEHMTAEQARVDTEIDIARRIQLGIVPERTDVSGEGCSACGFSRPARAVGGDFYDVIKRKDGRIAVVVGDVSGKGVAAAMLMGVAKEILHGALAANVGPAVVINSLNRRMCESNPEGMFISAFVAVLDPATGQVRYANAGHMPPLVVGERVELLEVDPGELLGLFDDVVIEEGELSLAEGEALLVYTDGAVEAVGTDGSFFGEKRFIDGLQAEVPYESARALADAAVHVVDGFIGDREQFDDLTIAVLMHGGAAGVSRLPASLELPCDMASFAHVREALFATDADDALKRKACLVCEEAFANTVSHSGATRIWAAISEGDGCLRIELSDDGAAFDPLAAEVADKDFEELDSGGMGIGLVRQLASHAEYRRDAGRNVLTVIVS